MRATLLAVSVLLAAASSASAQPADAGVSTAACAANSRALGISRVIEVDATSAPRFGQVQYKDADPLQDGEVVLTFDDGPLRTYTQHVLEALTQHCTKATFFMVGRMAAADPELVRDIARRGHTIGTHTWSHRNLRTLTGPRAKAEIELGLSAVQKALGSPVAPFFRFPYLADSPGILDHLQARNLAAFSIDIDSRDFRTRDPAEAHRAVINQLAVKRRGILLFHDIQPSTARGIKGLLDDLKARGYRVVHLLPRGRAATIAEYDALAEREMSRIRIAIAGQPLASRALVWPAAPDSAPTDPRPARSPQRLEEDRWRSRVFRY